MKIIPYLSLFSLFPYVCHSWSVSKGIIYNDTMDIYNLSGISWFGFETQDFVVNGLWSHSVEDYIKQMRECQLNTIRIPFSAEWILYNYDLYPYNGFVSSDFENQNKKSIEILDNVFKIADKYQMKIMLDLHRLHKEYISELWYSPTDGLFTEDDFFTTWFQILDRYQNHTNLIAIDLLNEPHGLATWGSSSISTDWNQFAMYAIHKINARYPDSKWLYFVEGIGWGKDFTNVHNFPIQLSKHLQNRLVYSPHTYGKSVVNSVDPNNKFQLYQDWDTFFGFLKSLGYTYIIGEYGGITDIDANWMNSLVDYLIENQMRNAFFWSLGPNSGDVKGLLYDDWTTIDIFKLKLIQRLQPYPTFY